MRNNGKQHQQRKPAPARFTLADRLSLTGQRLRQGETATRTTFAIAYRARHAAVAR